MTVKKKIDIDIPSGFRDYLPEEMIPRNDIIKKITETFELFGFTPLDTPAVEKENVLTAGDENFNKQIFKISTSSGGEKGLALRFDLTVPLARVMALRNSYFSKPFKRYQIGRVWRGERPQAGRYREFMQCDADIVGIQSPIADAEIISLMYETMVSLGVRDFSIRVNSRKILDGLCECAGIEKGKRSDVLRSMDKLDKKGWSGVSEELEQYITKKKISEIKEFSEIRAQKQEDAIRLAEPYLKKSKIGMDGLSDMREIYFALSALGVDRKKWEFDFSVARGLGYYTGAVFETVLDDMPGIGSIFSGGRYDGLISRFGGENIPATGASLGLDRLYSALEKLNVIQKKKSPTQALVCFLPGLRSYALGIVSDLRRNGIHSEFYFEEENPLRDQITYALKREIPFVVIVGPDEEKKGTTQVKFLKENIQKEMDKKDLSSFIKSFFS